MTEQKLTVAWVITQTLRNVTEATKQPFEVYTTKDIAYERATSLEKAQGDRYDFDVVEVEVDKFTRMAFRVTFYLHTLKWEASTNNILTLEEASYVPEVVDNNPGLVWEWTPIYALTRMDAIRKCKGHAQRIVGGG